MNANLKLYQSNGSPNSRRIRIFVAEKGIELIQVPVDLGAKEQFSETYVAINPRRVVPTLVLEDGTAIGEVPAIMRYLDEAFPDKPLLGVDAKEKRSSRCGSGEWSSKALQLSWKRCATAPLVLRDARSLVRMITSRSRRWSIAGWSGSRISTRT